MSTSPGAPRRDPDLRSLRLSLVATALIGSVGLGWGLVSGSRVMLFDGIYTFAGVVLTGVSLLAARAASSPPTVEFPFGRHAATPLAVGLQGAALMGTIGYGAIDAVIVITHGGSDVAAGAVLVYGLVTAVACLLVALLLRKQARRSDLVAAEMVSWRAGMLLSCVYALGGALGVFAPSLGIESITPYVDPSLVIVASAIVLPMAVGLVRTAARELLEASPGPDLSAAIARAVHEGATAGLPASRELPGPIVRATKLGRRLYVEVDFVVSSDEWSVAEEDAVREAITANLEELDYQVWATIEITTNPALAAD